MVMNTSLPLSNTFQIPELLVVTIRLLHLDASQELIPGPLAVTRDKAAAIDEYGTPI